MLHMHERSPLGVTQNILVTADQAWSVQTLFRGPEVGDMIACSVGVLLGRFNVTSSR